MNPKLAVKVLVSARGPEAGEPQHGQVFRGIKTDNRRIGGQRPQLPRVTIGVFMITYIVLGVAYNQYSLIYPKTLF